MLTRKRLVRAALRLCLALGSSVLAAACEARPAGDGAGARVARDEAWFESDKVDYSQPSPWAQRAAAAVGRYVPSELDVRVYGGACAAFELRSHCLCPRVQLTPRSGKLGAVPDLGTLAAGVRASTVSLSCVEVCYGFETRSEHPSCICSSG